MDRRVTVSQPVDTPVSQPVVIVSLAPPVTGTYITQAGDFLVTEALDQYVTQ